MDSIPQGNGQDQIFEKQLKVKQIVFFNNIYNNYFIFFRLSQILTLNYLKPKFKNRKGN
jgi:hypothetical protein